MGLNAPGSEGVLIDNPSSGNSAGNSILNSVFEYFDVAARVGNTAQSYVSNVSIRYCYFENTRGYEIVLGNQSNRAEAVSVTVEGNYFYSQKSAVHAVYARRTSGLSIRGCRSVNHSGASFDVLPDNMNFTIKSNVSEDASLISVAPGARGRWETSNGLEASQ